MTRRQLFALGVAVALASGCARSGGENELTVFAAASLTEAFDAMAKEFADANPGHKVVVSYAGSQNLRTQIEQGADADVFASANKQHMDELVSRELVEPPMVFAHNELTVVVPKNNPAQIKDVKQLDRASTLVLCDESVPAGAYADRVLESVGSDFATTVKHRVASRELDVRQALQKVILGEADASVVYATDAAAAGDKVKSISIPEQHNVVASYPIGVVSDTRRSELAERFVDFVRSERGAAVLERYGFRPADVITAGR